MSTPGNTSRLAQMQMKYQQKQQLERNQKRSELSGGRTLAAIEINESKKITSIGVGKVRQMFDERRQRTTGIDKSYPLQPISSRTSPIPASTKTLGTRGSTFSDTVNSRRLIASADSDSDSEFLLNRLNGNYIISKKQTDGDYLDNEKFPESFDFLDEDSSISNSISLKLPNVGKQMSGLNLQSNTLNNNIKLKPVANKKPISDILAKPLNGNKNMAPAIKNRLPAQVLTKPNAEKLNIGRVRPAVLSSSNTTKNISANKLPTSAMATPKLSKPSISSAADNTNACKVCGRHFNEDRLEKHESICKSTTTKKRKIFDVTKHRTQGTDAEQFLKKSTRVKKSQENATVIPKKNDWRRKHEEFIAAIRGAKQVQAHLARGGKLSDLPPPPPSENPDYLQCPHCGRKFNASAAERHIPKCANFQHNKSKPGAAKSIAKRKY